jgi:hypothetical protein
MVFVSSKMDRNKIVSAMNPQGRIKMLLGLIFAAESMLLLFGFIPQPWNILCL